MRKQKGGKGVIEGESVVGKGRMGRCCRRCEGASGVLLKTDKQCAMFNVYLQIINNNIYKGT
jgi:hypothetical protein